MGFKEKFVFGARKLGRTLSKKAPTLMVVGGTIGLIAAGVAACKATASKLDATLEEHKQKAESLRQIRDGEIVLDSISTEDYAKNEYKKQLAALYFQTTCKLLKAYAPALILAALSAASILTGHNVLKKRHLAAVAECYAVQNTLTEYRKRVAGRLGDEAERLLYVGGEKQIVTDAETDPETGEVRATQSHEAIVSNCKRLPHYTYIVSADTVHSFVLSTSDANFQRLIQDKVRYANDYFGRHGQCVLGDIMRGVWKNDYLTKHGEIFGHGWWAENPLCDPLPEIYPIDVTIKMISEPGQPRMYAVTFENVQGDIGYAMDIAKKQAREAEKQEKRATRKNIQAHIKEATA